MTRGRTGRAIHIAMLLLAAVATRAHAQATDPGVDAEAKGRLKGLNDGRRRGLELGSDIGRTQVLFEAWQSGVRRGLLEGQLHPRVRDEISESGWSAGQRPGREIGLQQGREQGRLACAQAFARLLGRPVYVTGAPPPPPAVEPAHVPACDEPEDEILTFGRGRRIRTSLAEPDRWPHDLPKDIPDRERASRHDLEDRARDEDRIVAPALRELWIQAYSFAYDDAFDEAFRDARGGVTWDQLRRAEDEGRARGEFEARRREECRAFRAGFARGVAEGHDQGFEQGWSEGWSETEALHLEHPVILVTEATLGDAGDEADGVIEPGERAELILRLVNAGMVDAGAESVSVEAVASLGTWAHSIEGPRAQSEKGLVVSAGMADAGAPLGAGVSVRVIPENGVARLVESRVRRPVELESVAPALAVEGDSLVHRVRATVRSLATRATDRGLELAAGDQRLALGTVGPGEVIERDLVVPATPDAVDAESAGEVRLDAGATTWMRRAWTHRASLREALDLALALQDGGATEDAVLARIAGRLHAEHARALSEPKLYKELGERSELAQLAAALDALPPADAAKLRARLADPMLRDVARKGTPPKVRRAVRAALLDK